MASRGQKRKSVDFPSPNATKKERPPSPAHGASSASSIADVPFKVVYKPTTHPRPTRKPKTTFGKRRKSTATSAANPSRRNSITSTSTSPTQSAPTSPIFSPTGALSFLHNTTLASSPTPSTSPSAAGSLSAVAETFDVTARPAGMTIQPASAWESLKSRTFILISQQLIRTGQTLLIRTPSTRLPQGAPIHPSEYPQFWVGRLMEIRANDPANVFLLVRWWYWPDELPGGGRRKWMGKREVVGSEWFDVVRVDSLAGVIDAPVEWREGEEKGLPEGEGLVWRQWIDGRAALRGGVRGYCVCGGAWSGEKTMVRCSGEGCGVWLHEECVVEDVLRRVEGGGSSPNGAAPMTPSPTPAAEVQMKLECTADEEVGNVINVDTSAPSTPQPKEKGSRKEKKGYAVRLVNKAGGCVTVAVKEKGPRGGSREFEESVVCLACRSPIH